MSSTFYCNQHPAEYFSNRQKSSGLNTNISSYIDRYSPLDGDSDSAIQSPATSTYSPSFGTSTEIGPDCLQFGTFEDWMHWEYPSDNTVSPAEEYLKIEPVSPVIKDLDFLPTVDTRNDFKDSAIFGSISEDSPFQSSEEDNIGLYSTPLSWSRPAVGGPLVLSLEEEAKLRRIAMPETAFSLSPEPEPEHRKRKSIVDDEEEQDDDGSSKRIKNDISRVRPMKKTAHNMIEKRYRTNLNDKIATLRDAVPSLRAMSKENATCKEDEHGLTPAHKLNKATVLSKATEYIKQLEKRDKFLTKENAKLKSRVDAFEMLVMARQENGQFVGGGLQRMI